MRATTALGTVVAAVCLALVPGTAHAECTTPELPVVGCVTPEPAPSETPTPEPTPTPTPGPETTPAPVPQAEPTVAVPEQPQPDVASYPALEPGPVPVAGPTPVETVAPVVLSVAPVRQEAPVVAVSPLPGVVASSFALVVFGLLAIPLLLGFLAGLRPATALPAPADGGTVDTRRTRLWTGMAVLGAAALVGGVGWYRLSGEPLLNRQIPFLASAGILVVLLSVLGGALIISEQLRGDQNRIGELEDAVRALTEALAPVIEQPPRVAVEEPVAAGRSRARRS